MCEQNFGNRTSAKACGKSGLVLLLLLYFALGATFSVIVPLWEAPDELRHFIYSKYLIDHFSLPPLSHTFSENPVTLAFHPPLYHALMAPLASGYSKEDPQKDIRAARGDRRRAYIYTADGTRFPYHGIPLRAHLMRVMSLLLGTGVVYCTWRIAAKTFPAECWLPFVATSLVALNPQFIFINSSVNDQALSSLLGALVLLILAQAINDGIRPGLSIALGFVLGAILLTTTSAILFVPVILAGILASGIRFKKALLNVTVVFAIALVVAGGWYMRNAVLWNDPFLWSMHKEVFGRPFLRESAMSMVDFLNLLRLLHRSFWGVFGSMSIPLSAGIYWALECFTGLCIVGFLRVLSRRKEFLDSHQIRILLVFLLAVIVFFASIINYNFTFISAQGRYLFVVLPAIGVLGATGLLRGIRIKPALTSAVVFASFLALNLTALIFFIWPAYYR